ncbi:hypothetical protein CVT26_001902 [Gymnopilus dilepis]|uniref:Pinin/SDK/MemA protein domain-containing protein n=1 Tax=Gymnopilus dilepis TaxID=231916 RepID=A0A409Y3Z5_9AGAR|nr:hypothetical protein CVT26_001902 [Gymnopilus dilepis]
MSADDSIAPESQIESSETLKSPTEPPQENENGTATNNEVRKQRPRLDLSGALGGASGKERKRGKSMFGILVGTLNKAKIEDKERNASDAAKKRQLIEQRLQAKLRKETDSVRRAEDAKKDKTLANRKEEDLQIKDSIYKLRRTRLPLLANFLLTSDVIPSEDSPPPSDSTTPDLAKILTPPPRSHPPPLYYLPAVLTPAQEAFLNKRKAEVAEAAEKEWELFREERAAGIEEIKQLRQRVAEEEARRKSEKSQEDKEEQDAEMTAQDEPPSATGDGEGGGGTKPESKDVEMDVDESSAPQTADKDKDSEGDKKDKGEKKEDSTMQGDDEDAVEY